jgi:hypothetical protein
MHEDILVPGLLTSPFVNASQLSEEVGVRAEVL